LASGGTVTLRGLDLDGLATAANCGNGGNSGLINFIDPRALHVQKVKINNLLGSSCDGIFFTPSGSATLDVSGSDITDNASGGIGGRT
jgi:hypothetical protein